METAEALLRLIEELMPLGDSVEPVSDDCGQDFVVGILKANGTIVAHIKSVAFLEQEPYHTT
jgi:hypothetical protein